MKPYISWILKFPKLIEKLALKQHFQIRIIMISFLTRVEGITKAGYRLEVNQVLRSNSIKNYRCVSVNKDIYNDSLELNNRGVNTYIVTFVESILDLLTSRSVLHVRVLLDPTWETLSISEDSRTLWTIQTRHQNNCPLELCTLRRLKEEQK